MCSLGPEGGGGGGGRVTEMEGSVGKGVIGGE